MAEKFLISPGIKFFTIILVALIVFGFCCCFSFAPNILRPPGLKKVPFGTFPPHPLFTSFISSLQYFFLKFTYIFNFTFNY